MKIGNMEEISSHHLLIPENMSAFFDISVKGWEVQVEIKFDDTPASQGVKIMPDGSSKVVLLFEKWNNPFGSSLTEPFALADHSSGGQVLLMCSNYRIGTTNQFFIQFLYLTAGEKA